MFVTSFSIPGPQQMSIKKQSFQKEILIVQPLIFNKYLRDIRRSISWVSLQCGCQYSRLISYNTTEPQWFVIFWKEIQSSLKKNGLFGSRLSIFSGLLSSQLSFYHRYIPILYPKPTPSPNRGKRCYTVPHHTQHHRFFSPKKTHTFRSAAEAALNKRATMVEIVATCAP